MKITPLLGSSSKHKGYPGRKGKPPQQGEHPWRKTVNTREIQEVDLRVNDFMRQHEISAEHAIEFIGNYYYYNDPATTWEKTAEDELVNNITLGFERGRKDQCLHFPQTFSLYL